MQKKQFESFSSFYPYYLAEHSNPTCRKLHYIGSSCVLLLMICALVFNNYYLLAYTPIAGYGFAWIGHFFFENNKPATFKHPLYSFWGDWVMYGAWIKSLIKRV
ncbi:Mpo1-like protein [Pseudoalteromonas xiamenensis]